MSKWIRVEDELPKFGSYLVMWIDEVIVAHYIPGYGWNSTTHDEGFITHWQPLPSPPKEGE